MRKATLLLLASYASIAPSPAQSVQVLPRDFESREGSERDELLTRAEQPARLHWNYVPSHFSTTGAIEITQIDLRPDGSHSQWSSSSLPQVELSLGLLRAAHRDPIFGNNLEDRWDDSFPQPFFSGAWNLSAGSATSVPRPWSISIQGPPLRFDPRDGRTLTLEWRVRAGASAPWASLDAGIRNPGTDGVLANLQSADGRVINYASERRLPIVRVHYRPAQATFAAFRTGNQQAPTTTIVGNQVQFEDLSSTPVPGGIQSWAWDFENDGVVDSTLQHPLFRYFRCGEYDVRLTVTDAANGSHSTLRRRLVQVLDPGAVPLVADFSSSRVYTNEICPATVSYLDRSTGPITSWAWDFDSDGIIDSRNQNPRYVVTRPGRRTVRLEITSACGTRFMEREEIDTCNTADECLGAWQASTIDPHSNRFATDSTWPSPCFHARSDVWYWIWTQNEIAGYSVSACAISGPAGFRPQVQIYTGTCANLVLLACVESSCVAATSPNFLTHPGQSYYARISDAQGLQGEFRLDVRAFNASMGNIARPFPSCGGAALDVQGAPRPGNALSFALNAQGRPSAIWLGTGISPTPLCDIPCVLTTFTHIVVPGAATVFPIPNGSYVLGARFFAQGAILGQGAGCDLGNGNGLLLSETIQVDVR